MGHVKLGGNPVSLEGNFPGKNEKVNDFTAIGQDLSEFSFDDFKGKKKILNIFPSIDTEVCALSVRKFNEAASKIKNSVVICLSMDLPFAQKRFCGAEGINNVTVGSLFRNPDFGKDYGLLLKDGPLKGLLARAVVVLDENNSVLHSQLVEDIANEPDYDKAVSALKA